MNGTKDHTSGGLKRSDLTYNKKGRIVSKYKSAEAKKNLSLNMWVKAAKKEGYLQKGETFRKMPKRGTKAHAKITKTYNEMKDAAQKKRR